MIGIPVEQPMTLLAQLGSGGRQVVKGAQVRPMVDQMKLRYRLFWEGLGIALKQGQSTGKRPGRDTVPIKH